MLRPNSYIVSYKKVIIYEYKEIVALDLVLLVEKKAVQRNLFILSQLLFCAVVTNSLI